MPLTRIVVLAALPLRLDPGLVGPVPGWHDPGITDILWLKGRSEFRHHPSIYTSAGLVLNQRTLARGVVRTVERGKHAQTETHRSIIILEGCRHQTITEG
jgi:hypothetical protein